MFSEAALAACLTDPLAQGFPTALVCQSKILRSTYVNLRFLMLIQVFNVKRLFLLLVITVVIIAFEGCPYPLPYYEVGNVACTEDFQDGWRIYLFVTGQEF